jgi:hypothetical protein
MQILFFERIEGWVCASPNTAWSTVQVARETVRAAMSQDACWLVGHDIRWVNHLCLQTHLLIHVLAILNFQGFPGFFGHELTPLTIEYTLNFMSGKE